MQVNQTSALKGASSGAVEGLKGWRPTVAPGVAAARDVATGVSPGSSSVGQAPSITRLADWPEGRHQRVADAQQTLGYLERLVAGLQALKTTLSNQLARPTSAVVDKKASREAERLTAVLQERNTATAGRLDAQLRFDDAANVRQAFKVKGLDLASLRAGDREVLNFAVNGSQDLVSVVVDPELSDAAMVRRLNQAFAPLSIRVERDAQGELLLSVPRDQWASVRDSLAVRGNGQRFPAGQLTRVRAEPAPPEALRPETWIIDSPQGTRKALVEVMGALQRAGQAREAAQGVIGVDSREDAARVEAERVWAQAAAQSFKEQMQRPGFGGFAQVAPAVMGVTRSRVEGLLAS